MLFPDSLIFLRFSALHAKISSRRRNFWAYSAFSPALCPIFRSQRVPFGHFQRFLQRYAQFFNPRQYLLGIFNVFASAMPNFSIPGNTFWAFSAFLPTVCPMLQSMTVFFGTFIIFRDQHQKNTTYNLVLKVFLKNFPYFPA